MTSSEMTIDALRRILQEGAGADETVNLDGDILDSRFEDLGYDSLALLETAARIEREYGITLEDELTTSAQTPRELLAVVNKR
ncbi:MAG: acyl carrier protein [Actinomycetota bacterium]|nr:acyl carrier protein [Actinomycetota bacterium]